VLEILVVDDHPVMRAGLQCMLDTAPDLTVVGTAADGTEAVRLAAELEPDVVLMDLSMPGMDGLAATRLVVRLDPAPKVVVLTSTGAAVTVREAFAAGAVGYLLKDMAPASLIAALRGLADERPAVDPRAASILARQRQADHDARASVLDAPRD
jgi:DNA-binding NarL/FixJ family response regulator